MQYKPDWEQTRERFEAFWQNEIVDRCCLAVTAPRAAADWREYHETCDLQRLADDDHDGIRRWWLDPAENLRRQEMYFANTFYGGEALPIAFTNWGAMAMCGFYGCEPIFNKKSVWYPPVIEDWANWQWHFDKASNPYWQSTLAITQAFAAAAPGRFMAGMPELGSAGDLLSLMRGMDNLCLDLYDEPDAVAAAIGELTRSFLALQDELYEIIRPSNQGGGVLPWMSLWMPGRHGNQLACDFSSVLSPELFRTFFRDELRQEAAWTDFATYHLDGPACLRLHLDTLLEIDTIKAIEWTPGAGSPPAATPAYIPYYQRIQAAGKKLVLIAEPEEIEFLLTNLSPRGLFIKTEAASEAQANELLQLARRLATRKSR